METKDPRYEELLAAIASLTERVYKLEQWAGVRPKTFPPEPTRHSPTEPKQFPMPLPPRESAAPAALESRIGGQWLNRIGIVAVLFGVSYFLKYAFDNAWIGPAGRVVTGLVSGLGVVFWSEYVRKRGYGVYSFSLKAVGIGILYLSLWASSQVYALVPYGLAFFSMTMVTASTAAMALWQDSQAIAAFAVLGGFITPVVLSTSVNNAAGLFSYLAILDLGVLFISRYRPWQRVLLGSQIGTFLLYAAWHDRFYSADQFQTALITITLFFAFYALAPMMARRFADSDVVLLLMMANASVYFFEVDELFIHRGSTRPVAIVAVALAAVFLLIARQLRGFATISMRLHEAVAICFLIAAVPLGLDAQWITIGWFIEAGALMWATRHLERESLRYLACASLALAMVRLLVVDQFVVTRLVLNERMLTYAIGIGVLAFISRMSSGAAGFQRKALPIVIVAINVLALSGLTHEITDAWHRQSLPAIARDFSYSALWMAYGAGLMFAGFRKKSQFLRWQALILIAVTSGKVFLYDTAALDRGYRILSFIGLGLLLLATSFFYQRRNTSKELGRR
jgi:uncharacterized membrane protein